MRFSFCHTSYMQLSLKCGLYGPARPTSICGQPTQNHFKTQHNIVYMNVLAAAYSKHHINNIILQLACILSRMPHMPYTHLLQGSYHKSRVPPFSVVYAIQLCKQMNQIFQKVVLWWLSQVSQSSKTFSEETSIAKEQLYVLILQF